MSHALGIVPHLVVSNGAAAIDFYKRAFGAEEIARMPAEDGKRLMHAELKIGQSALYLCDDFPEYCGGKSRTPGSLGGTPTVLHQTVADCDAAIKRAADAGAKITMPPQDMFWGDRYGQITDPFGHIWSFATPLKK
jgi:PhnB protein